MKLDIGVNTVFGGHADTNLQSIHPTIMTDVPSNANIMVEETFAPILNVFTYNHADEAILSIQQQSKPLALYIFTKDDDFIETILSKTSSSGVAVNDSAMHALGRHPESLGDLADLVTPVRNLLYCLDLELFWIAYTTHIKYLLFA